MRSRQQAPTSLPPRARLSLLSLVAVFLLIFSGLFCGFLIAHFFPEQVVRLVYGVSTETPAPVPMVAADQSEAPFEGIREPEDGRRERELSASLRRQSAMEAVEPVAAEPVKAADHTPHFAKRRKPAPPGAEAAVPVPGDASTSSFPPAAQYPAAEWRGIDAQAGVVDSVIIASKGAPLGDARPLPTDTLEVTGWLGDPALGLRFKDVLFSMCGKIIGHTKVGSPRPDVVKAVHPNLLPSGWHGRLYVGYLPPCPNPVLHVLGVVPGSMTVMTVGTAVPLKLPVPVKPPSDAPRGAPLFTPKNVVAARFTAIDVLPDNAEMRRCGAANCTTVGQISKGRYQGHIAEEADGWVLLIMSDKAGWLPRSQITWAG